MTDNNGELHDSATGADTVDTEIATADVEHEDSGVLISASMPTIIDEDEHSFELPPAFLAVTACPACHARFAVDYSEGELVCTSSNCGLAFPVRNGVPILLIDQARPTRS